MSSKTPLGPAPHRPELERLIEESRRTPITEEMLRDQRISFAFGNAPENPLITKDTVREASRKVRLEH